MITLTGGKELAKFLEELPDRVSKQYMKTALKAGAEVVLAAAEINCPSSSGAGRDGLHINVSTAGGAVTAKVSNDPKQFYLKFQDGGWKDHGKWVNGQFFMEKALEQTAEQATQIIADVLKSKIESNAKS